MMNNYDDILKKNIEINGTMTELVVLMEELAELTKEITKYIRYGTNRQAIKEELADVLIMCRQLMIMTFIEDDELLEEIERKIRRQIERCEVEKNIFTQ